MERPLIDQSVIKEKIFKAARDGDVQTFDSLRSWTSFFRDENYQTPLHVSCEYNQLEFVEYLLASSSFHFMINSRDKRGWTPLHVCCRKRNMVLSEKLIDGGAEVNLRTYDGETVLHLIARTNSETTSYDFVYESELIISFGSLLYVRDQNERTPLDTVAWVGDVHGMRRILARTGLRSLYTENKYGQNTFYWAEIGNHPHVLKYIHGLTNSANFSTFLPRELFGHIISYIEPQYLSNIASVCRTFYGLSSGRWKKKYLNDGLHVLVSSVNHKVIQLILKRISPSSGLKIASTSSSVNGRETVELIKSTRPDVVLMDYAMPELDGMNTTRCIREEVHPEHQPYIIGLLSYSTQDVQVACMEVGMDDVIDSLITKASLLPPLRDAQEIIISKRESRAEEL